MSGPLLSILAAASLRTTFVVAVVGGLLRILGIRDVPFSHRVWTATTVAMLTMPVLPLLVPPIQLNVPRLSALTSDSEPLSVPVDRFAAVHPVAREQPGVGVASAPVPAPAYSSPIAAVSQADRPGINGLSRDPGPLASSPLSLALVASAAYLFVAAMMLFRMGIGWLAARRIVRAGRAVDLAHECASVASIARVSIIESKQVATPLVVGILRPVIVLPVAWSTWSHATLNAVCAHELAHVRRQDPLVAFLSRVNCILFWFHPAAWWLERRLGALSEQACDDEAVERVQDANGYADALLNVARAVHAQGRRVSWQTMGIAGSGSLSARIERVLCNASPSRLSWTPAATVVGSLILVILLVAACRQQTVVAAYSMSDEQERHELALRDSLKRIDERLGEPVRRGRPRPSDSGEIAELEAAANRAPDDLTALDRLLIAYWHRFATFAPDLSNVGRRDVPPVDAALIAKRRQRILWLITNHPESTLAGTVQARLFPEALAPFFPGDPEGFAQGKAAWLAVADRPNVTSAMLDHAASFFELIDGPLAERLLLRARDLSPGEAWSVRLGGFYADAITNRPAAWAGGRHVFLAGVPTNAPMGIRFRPTGAYYSGIAKARLEASTDPILLMAAGWTFSITGHNSSSFNPATWARECYERALGFAPQWVLPRSEIIWLKRREGRQSELLFPGVPPDQEYGHVLRLPEQERLGPLAEMAKEAFRDLEALDRYHDPNLKGRADMDRTNAGQASREALKLADKRRDDPEYGTAIYLANMTLGGLALRDGNKAEALRYLKTASHAPVSERLAYANGVVLGWEAPSLPQKLLAAGERDAVAGFLEQMATLNLATRTALRDTAAAIRRGENPRIDGSLY